LKGYVLIGLRYGRLAGPLSGAPSSCVTSNSSYRTAGRCTLKGVRATTKGANIRPRNYPA